jgi:hypothetical protein
VLQLVARPSGLQLLDQVIERGGVDREPPLAGGEGLQDLTFCLPSDWRPVLTILECDRHVPRRCRTPEQAWRVS